MVSSWAFGERPNGRKAPAREGPTAEGANRSEAQERSSVEASDSARPVTELAGPRDRSHARPCVHAGQRPAMRVAACESDGFRKSLE